MWNKSAADKKQIIMKLSVVIVNFNVKYYLEQTICSVYRAARNLELDVWVVDNASTDGSQEYITRRYPQVHYLYNEENVGFSRANNQAIRLSEGEYVLLLNPDTIVGEDVLDACVRFLDEHPQAGAAGVSMLKDDGGFAWESRRGVPTPFTSFCKMSGLCSLFPKSRTFGKYYMRYLDKDQINEIEIISGAFNMLRRSTLDRVGLLDETFFMYGEDIDLSYRILLGGYKNYYLPVHIVHYKGESTKKSSFRYVHTFYNAMLIFFNKHFRRKHLLLSWLIHLAVVLRGVLDLLKNKFLHQQSDPDDEAVGNRVLCLGGREALAEMKKILEDNGMEAVLVEADEERMPEGHLTDGLDFTAYDRVAYDVDAYSFQCILKQLYRGCARKPLLLGTYSRQWGHLITHKKIWYGKN